MVEPANRDRPPLPDDGPLPGEVPLPEDGPLPGEEPEPRPAPFPASEAARVPAMPTSVPSSVPALIPASEPFDDRAFGDPTDSERVRAEDRFVFELPKVPTDLSWPRLRDSVFGRDPGTRWQRASLLALGLVLVAMWGYSQRLKRWPLETLVGHTKPVFALAVAPGKSLLATGGDDHAIRLWSFETGQLLRTIEVDKKPTGDGVLALAFSPKGDFLVAATGGGAQVWKVETGELARALDPWERGALAAAYSPKGELVATSRRGDDAIRVYSMPEGKLVTTLRGHTGPVFALAFAPSGDQLASAAGDGTVRIWSLASFTESRTMLHPGNVLAVAFSPVGDVLASAGDDHVLRLWGAFDGQPAATDFPTKGSVRSFAFSAEGDRLFFGDDDGVVRAIAPRTGALLWSRVQAEKPVAVALSADGERLAVGLVSGEVPVWWAPRTK